MSPQNPLKRFAAIYRAGRACAAIAHKEGYSNPVPSNEDWIVFGEISGGSTRLEEMRAFKASYAARLSELAR